MSFVGNAASITSRGNFLFLPSATSRNRQSVSMRCVGSNDISGATRFDMNDHGVRQMKALLAMVAISMPSATLFVAEASAQAPKRRSKSESEPSKPQIACDQGPDTGVLSHREHAQL
jgi:hypothetical protein